MVSTFAQTQTTTASDSREVLLSVKNLKKHFPITSGIIFQRQVGAVKPKRRLLRREGRVSLDPV